MATVEGLLYLDKSNSIVFTVRIKLSKKKKTKLTTMK